MNSPESYGGYLERCKTEVQQPPLELHHIKSRHGWTDLEHEVTNHIWLSQCNHDYATLLQCWEEDYPLLCPWQANRLAARCPDLSDEIKFWLSRKGTLNSVYVKDIDNSHLFTPEVCSKAGITSWNNKSAEEQLEHMCRMRANINHKARTEKLIQQENFVGKQPWWHRLVEGQIERKRGFTPPAGIGWKPGKGDSYIRRKVRCTITGHEGTQSSLARWQKNRGIDPSNREFIGEDK